MKMSMAIQYGRFRMRYEVQNESQTASLRPHLQARNYCWFLRTKQQKNLLGSDDPGACFNPQTIDYGVVFGICLCKMVQLEKAQAIRRN